MFTETHPADLAHLDSLVDNPLGSIAIPYVEALNAQHYAKYTIERYVNCVIHFGCWLNAEGVELQSINQAVIHRYLHDLLLVSSASATSSDSIKMDRAALKHLLTFLPQQFSVITQSPIEVELERFTDYLLNICGMSPQTCANRCHRSYRVPSAIGFSYPTKANPLSGQTSCIPYIRFADNLAVLGIP